MTNLLIHLPHYLMEEFIFSGFCYTSSLSSSLTSSYTFSSTIVRGPSLSKTDQEDSRRVLMSLVYDTRCDIIFLSM